MTVEIDPERYYRSMSVLFVDYAAAFRGITTKDYFDLYKTGLFNKTGAELVPVEAFTKSGGDLFVQAAFRFMHKHGEPGLGLLFRLGMVEETVFGE